MKKSFIVKFFAMLMLLATSTTMSAQTQYLCITEKGGGVTEIPLSEFPVLLVEDGLLKVAAYFFIIYNKDAPARICTLFYQKRVR